MKTIKISKPSDVPLGNLARKIATAMLKEHGVYTYTMNGKLYRLVLEEG